MRPVAVPTLCAVVAAAPAACAREADLIDGIFTDAQWEIIEGLSPLPDPPADPTNEYADDDAAAELGQMLYFDGSMAGEIRVDGRWGAAGETAKMSCAGCHAAPWFDDQQSDPNNVSQGVAWGTRNSPPIVNATYYQWFYWAGRADSLWGQAIGAAANGAQQAITRLTAAHTIFTTYADEYGAVFGDEYPLPDLGDPLRFPPSGSPKGADDPDGPWETMTPEDQHEINRIWVNFGKAIAAYERRLISRNAPFDQYVAGETDAINASAKRGLLAFIGKAACVECHDTPAFTDNEFHNVGVPQEGFNVPDEDTGRHEAVASALGATFGVDSEWSDDRDTGKLDGLEQSDGQKGQFRTKHLRQVAMTGPYMHTGNFGSLREVVEQYNEGGGESGFAGEVDELIVPLNLSDREIDDIVEFLETLTGEPVPDELTIDTSIR